MSEVAVVATVVRRAARSIEGAIGGLQRASLTEPLRHVVAMCAEAAGAAPLSSSASALQSEWREDEREWTAFARGHVSGVRSAAASLSAADALSAAEARSRGVDLTVAYVDADPTRPGVQRPTTVGVGRP